MQSPAPSAAATQPTAAATAAGYVASEAACRCVPLTTTVGFQQLVVREDGVVLMRSGFNEHVKSKNWAVFLERLLWDTV